MTEPETIPDLVQWAAEQFGDDEAVVDVFDPNSAAAAPRRITFAELATLVRRAATGCRERGVEPGDRVAIWGPNTLEWIVAALGAVSAGAICSMGLRNEPCRSLVTSSYLRS